MIGIDILFGAIAQTARYGLSVKRGDLDVTTPLLVDWPPAILDPHLVAAAGMLLAPEDTSVFQLEGQLSASVVESWERHLGVSIIADRIDTPYHRDGFTDLTVVRSVSFSSATPGRDNTKLYLVPSERFYGQLKGVKELVTATNAWMFEEEKGVVADISLGLLFSNDLLAKSITVLGQLPEATRSRVEHILTPLDIQFDIGRGEPNES